MEAVQAATVVELDTEVMAKERLRLQARMKGGGIKRAADVKYLTFLGAVLRDSTVSTAGVRVRVRNALRKG